MMDTHGVRNFGCTVASGLKNKPSRAIAKNTRGLVNSTVLSVPNVETITVIDTNATPAGPPRFVA
jgi:hypothetical protein